MRSLESIIALNEEIAALAASEHRVPFVPESSEDIDRWPPFPFPNLGSFEPDMWELTDQEWFVDATGAGREGEPALTVDQFREELRHYIARNLGHGFAITEEGPFQAYVNAFRQKTHKK